MDELKLIKHGFPPTHLVILGPTGTGKTVTVKKVLAELKLPHTYVVAEPSAYGTLVALGEAVLGSRKWGLSFAPLWAEVDSALSSPHIIVVDEAEKFLMRDEKGDHVLYYLSRREATGLILISNRLNLLEYIRDSRVKSSFKPMVKIFKPYTADELYSIIYDRALEALGEEGVRDVSPLKYIAALAAQKGGDARYAIDLLRESVKLVFMEDCDRITIKHIEKAKGNVEYSYIENSLRALSRAHKLMLIAALKSNYVGEAYSKYNQLAPRYAMDQLSERRLRDILGDLELMGFINIRRKGRQWYIVPSKWIPSNLEKAIIDELELTKI